MRDLVSEAALQWTYATESGGDAMTVAIRDHGLVVAVLGKPAGGSQDEVSDWMRDLATVAREAPPSEQDEGPIPTTLRQAVSALLFSHAEIWDRQGEGAILSLVLLEQDGKAGVGWAGNGRVTLARTDGGPDPQWIRVVDEEGHEGRVWMLPPGVGAKIECVWPADGVPAPGREWAALIGEWVAPPVPRESREVGPPALPPAPAMPDPERESSPPDDLPPPVLPDWLERRVTSSPIVTEPPAAELPPRLEASRDALDFASPLRPDDAGPSRPDDAEPPPLPASLYREDLFGVPAIPPEAPEPSAGEVPPLDRAEQPEEPSEDPDAFISETPWGATSGAAARAHAPDVAAPPVENLYDQPGAAFAGAESPGAGRWGAESPRTESPGAEPLADVPITEVSQRRRARRTAWPHPSEFAQEARRELPGWVRPAAIAAGVLVLLFVLALVLGRETGKGPLHNGGALEPVLAAIGIAPNRFDLSVTSQPEGASLRVDSVVLPEKTPVRIALKPGTRRVEVFFGDFGGETYTVTGRKSESLQLDAPLWGSLSVMSTEPDAPIRVSVDGEARGNVPVLIDRVAPGGHHLRFSGPGLDPWERTVDVNAGKTREVMAVPMRSPETGIVHVRSVAADDEGAPAAAGDPVYLDGELRGKTPLSLELPRGPHSVRVSHDGMDAPVQVVDLPGGNERFLTFDFAGGEPPLGFRHVPIASVPLGYPAVVAATLTGEPAPQVREMWLNVRLPDGGYRRYQMNLMPAPGGAAGSAVFPRVGFDAEGYTRYYVSAITQDGEEYYTEIYRAASERVPPLKRK